VESAGVLGTLREISESAPGDVAYSESSSIVWLLEAIVEGSKGNPGTCMGPRSSRVQEGRRVSR